MDCKETMSKNDIAVAVRGLSKSYTIAHNAAKHSMLGEALMHRIKNTLQRAEKETFWALKDIEFDTKKAMSSASLAATVPVKVLC